MRRVVLDVSLCLSLCPRRDAHTIGKRVSVSALVEKLERKDIMSDRTEAERGSRTCSCRRSTILLP